MAKRIDPEEHIGHKYNRLTVISYAGLDKNRRKTFLCQCDCGTENVYGAKEVIYGNTKSCGCLKAEKARENGKSSSTHGLKNHRLYSIMNKMKSRCYNPNHDAYARYGGRGIGICSEWRENITSFYDWAMSNGYADGLTIERIDNDRGYSPDNCKWITRAEQNKSRSNTIKVTLFGETKIVSDWLRDERITISKSTYQKRVNSGMEPSEALRRSL